MKNDQKVLVTGGSGFIGMNLMQSLIDDKFDVLNIDRSKPLLEQHIPYWKKVDLLDKEQLTEAVQNFQPDIIVHLAARTDLDETVTLKAYDDNVGGVSNLLSAVSHTDSVKKVLVTSSMLVCRIGYTPKTDEDYAPSTVYGESKVQTEKITRASEPDCCWAIVRPATIWGPYHYGLKSGFFSILDRGLYFHPGRQEVKKSYGYVGNSVFQLRALMEAPEEKVHKKVFYLSDRPMNLLDWTSECSEKLTNKPLRVIPYWIMKMAAIVGDIALLAGIKKFPMTSFRLKNMVTENIVDTDPMFAVAGEPPFSMSEGIDATVGWLQAEKS